ncbi:hypothetical protein FN846DRAFT_902300 [Sphaerosporella brunnea]|uniref:Uncharacterized protein n=1 Tax=Sphaerosporella brunnea TaxID=1250544 RepID=A0A5J5FB59_9PEZI|nr:hypothetical protein FN846DRAFT_902300 [Sphaerosporella brunnea]
MTPVELVLESISERLGTQQKYGAGRSGRVGARSTLRNHSGAGFSCRRLALSDDEDDGRGVGARLPPAECGDVRSDLGTTWDPAKEWSWEEREGWGPLKTSQGSLSFAMFVLLLVLTSDSPTSEQKSLQHAAESSMKESATCGRVLDEWKALRAVERPQDTQMQDASPAVLSAAPTVPPPAIALADFANRVVELVGRHLAALKEGYDTRLANLFKLVLELKETIEDLLVQKRPLQTQRSGASMGRPRNPTVSHAASQTPPTSAPARISGDERDAAGSHDDIATQALRAAQPEETLFFGGVVARRQDVRTSDREEGIRVVKRELDFESPCRATTARIELDAWVIDALLGVYKPSALIPSTGKPAPTA